MQLMVATKNIVLTDKMDAYVNSLVESGRFQNASEAIRASIRLMEERDAARQAWIDSLRVAVAVAEEDFRDGRFVEVEPGGIAAFFNRFASPNTSD